MEVEQRLSDLEHRMTVLETRFQGAIDSIERMIDEKFELFENSIDKMSRNIEELKYTVVEIDRKMDVSKVKYNGYEEKFATRLELSNVVSEIEKIKSERRGVHIWISEWSSVLAIIVSVVAILKAFGIL